MTSSADSYKFIWTGEKSWTCNWSIYRSRYTSPCKYRSLVPNKVELLTNRFRFAGSDTTAITLSAIIYYLLKNPQYLEKLLLELDEAKKKESWGDGYIKYGDSVKLPYFHAVCREGMRVHPGASARLPRVVPAGGREIAGQFIKEGVVVGTNPYVIHRDQEVFGEDADIFNPERWFRPESKRMDAHFQTVWQHLFPSFSCYWSNIVL